MSEQIPRFTLDGSEASEERLRVLCGHVLVRVKTALPPRKLEALVLGGGYGRGEGGVLKSSAVELPYNDLEFYVFLGGNRFANERQYLRRFQRLEHLLSSTAGLHVEFKLDSLRRFRQAPVSMFSYDLVSRHRVVAGIPQVFQGCQRHRQAELIPPAEATRLLLNRCTGLLLAKEFLSAQAFDAEHADFVGRNIAKARLALGDAILAGLGQYHWSCRERQKRLENFSPPEPLVWLEEVRRHHAFGVEFKLHPQRTCKPREALLEEHSQACAAAQRVWLWLETHRLRHPFSTPQAYSLCEVQKCPEPSGWRNWLCSFRTFGPAALLNRLAGRYPRERLLNTLPLLLWIGDCPKKANLVRHLQRQLQTRASDWPGLVNAYKSVWSSYA